MRTLSFLLTFIFTVLIAFQWHKHHTNYEDHDHKLLDQISIDNRLLDFGNSSSDQILTGFYVDSLQFKGANDVYLSGYIWQEFSVDLLAKHQPGVVLPNAIGSTIMRESYRNTVDGITVIGWYFEANLHQPFDYRDYPIDHKTVRLKVLPKEFSSNVVLVPSLRAYASTGIYSVFGVSKDIVLSGWDIDETFFDYIPLSFDTDFGLHDEHPRTNLPELSFNIVIQRDYLSAFIINITLLLVCVTLLYALIMMMTSDEDLNKKFSSSVSAAIRSCAGIFFVILVAHISVREKFPGSGIVYIEYFYLLSYVFIAATICAIYLFNAKDKPAVKGLLANEAALLKLGFWPLYSFCIYIITWHHFY